MQEIFTIGGGEFIVNVLNAVAAWTGGGGFRSLIQVVFVMGLIYALLVVAFSLNWKAWFNWFLGATAIYGVMIVPTTSVKVTDSINPGLAPAVVANVPIGLASIASVTSQMGDWLTQQAETVFVMPNALEYRTNGIIYGSRLYDKTKEFKYRDPRVRANLSEYFKQCLFYDFLLGFETPAAVMTSSNVLGAMGPGSPARAMTFWNEDGTTQIRTCRDSYNIINSAAGLQQWTEDELTRTSPSFFPDLAPAAARSKLIADLPQITAEFHGMSQTASQVFQQRALTEAFLEARANLSEADGDTFAAMRAEAQAKNTYTSIAQQAMTWVPLLNIVLTVVFYAMFPVLFPIFLFPRSGVTALKGYITGFFYLAAWGPLYAVLHMFVMSRTTEAMQAAAPGGFTMATIEGIDHVNADTATIAGFLMMSIPFLAAGMARGAMAVSSQATSMLAPAQSAAEAAAVERTTGNYAYGNVSSQNMTSNVVQRDQWNTAPSFSSGMGRSSFREADGGEAKTFADGSMAYDTRDAISTLAQKPSRTSGFGTEARQALSEGYGRVEQLRETANESWSATATAATNLTNRAETQRASSEQTGSGTNNSLTNMYEASETLSNDLQSKFGLSKADSERISRVSSITGSADAGLGTPGGKLSPLQAQIGARVSAQALRDTGRVISTEQGFSEVHGYVERQTSTMQARQSREDFNRDTSTSSDSRTRALSEDLSSSIAQSRSAGLEASTAEETYSRISNDVSQAESRGYSLNYDETQDFVNFTTEELAKPENSALRSIGYHPGMAAPNDTQIGARDMLLQRFADSQIEEMRGELGLVPDIPARTMEGPAVRTGEGVREWGESNSDRLRGDAPAVSVRANSGDAALAADVAGRVESGQDYVLDGGRGLRNEGVPAYREASALRDGVGERNHQSIGRTLPIVSPLMDKVDEWMGPSGSTAAGPSGPVSDLPVSGSVSSGFGMRKHPVTGKMSGHRGMDIAAPAGTPLRATLPGVVDRVSANEHNDGGNYIVVDHSDGSERKYLHMQGPTALQPGDQVSVGQELGKVGSTGRSTGPHLHYEIWRDGKPVNPQTDRKSK